MQRAWHVRAASCLPTPKYLCQGRQGAAAGVHGGFVLFTFSAFSRQPSAVSLKISILRLRLNNMAMKNASHTSVILCKLGCKRFPRLSQTRSLAHIIDGRRISQEIQNDIRSEVEKWTASGHRKPHLSAVLVGEDPASFIYVRNKMRAAENVGIASRTIKCPESISEEQLLNLVSELNNDAKVDGILVQLPLPDHITERAVCNAVAPYKDVDGFNIVNLGRLCLDMNTIIPCTPLAVVELIKRTGVETKGKNAVICGRSKNVGMPIAMLLHSDGTGETGGMDMTTNLCHRYTPPEQLALLTKNADIIVSAAGVPNLITGNMVKQGACVIDVGINRITSEKSGRTKLVGDVDFNSVSQVAGFLTPVPGGVGPMTVAMLMRNTLLAAKKSVVYNIREPGAVLQKKASQLKP